jgi:SWI/SNF-related matrix-associated actin-dependent regulator of chromatin subfamily A member 5
VTAFTEDEDKFLLVSLHRLGYGNWEDLKSAIRTSWMFRFDWYAKTLLMPVGDSE